MLCSGGRVYQMVARGSSSGSTFLFFTLGAQSISVTSALKQRNGLLSSLSITESQKIIAFYLPVSRSNIDPLKKVFEHFRTIVCVPR